MLLTGQRLRPFSCRGCSTSKPAAVLSSRPQRCQLRVVAVGDFFDKLKGGAGKPSSSEEAARRALQNTFGSPNAKKSQSQDSSKASQGGGSGAGGPGSGGGGGGGFGDFGNAADADGGGGSQNVNLWAELWSAISYSWTVFWNLALFLAFASMLHRSLDWCVSVELLLLVGAGQQAFERVAGVFCGVIEWVEKNLLGWDIPGDENMIPQYQNIKMFYPEQHAYTFDQYRYDMTEKEKTTLKNMYALRHYEREGGRRGDVTEADVAAVMARHDPLTADRKEYARAVAEGRVEDYWAARKHVYEAVTRQRFVRPPGVPPPSPA